MGFVVLLAVLLAATSTRAGNVEVSIMTPATIELSEWCGYSKPCGQAAADAAQSHCSQHQRHAQLAAKDLVERSFSDGEKFVFRFNCVR